MSTQLNEMYNALSLLQQQEIFNIVATLYNSTNKKTFYPEGYESVIGSINDDTFVRPVQGSFEADARRVAF